MGEGCRNRAGSNPGDGRRGPSHRLVAVMGQVVSRWPGRGWGRGGGCCCELGPPCRAMPCSQRHAVLTAAQQYPARYDAAATLPGGGHRSGLRALNIRPA